MNNKMADSKHEYEVSSPAACKVVGLLTFPLVDFTTIMHL